MSATGEVVTARPWLPVGYGRCTTGVWSVSMTASLDRVIDDGDARGVGTAVAAATGTRLVLVSVRDLRLSVTVEESVDDMLDAGALFGAYEQAVADAGYEIGSWESAQLHPAS